MDILELKHFRLLFGQEVANYFTHFADGVCGVCSYVKGRDYDPDRERAEMKKMKKQIKREARGAARELRHDNRFLAEEKSKENAAFEQEREEKYKKAMSFLEQQESAFKSGQLGKGRKRKKR